MLPLRVSFIIPVLNGEKDIGRCLDSIRNQKFPKEEYEVLVVDNGSTDRTCQIVKSFGFDLQVISGVSVAALRNRGARIARGDYLAFVDADVELASDWLKNGLAAFGDQQVVAAGCFPQVPQPGTWVQQVWDIHQRGHEWKRSGNPIEWLPSMNLLVRRNIFLSVGGFSEYLETAEDVDLCYRITQRGTILCTPAMEAVHWGEARDVPMFWRKEVWRGKGNLKGVFSHGLRWDEFPSLGYPIYILCLFVLLGLSCILDLWNRQFTLTPFSLSLLTLPAFFLAIATMLRVRQPRALPGLFLLYLIYGCARAYSIISSGIYYRRA
jgi:glycosyltransferase involved in cell wall biosynthesis